jgi:hypothetical protein
MTTKEKARARHLKKTYNISLEEYDSLLEAQDYRCAICGVHQSECKTRLAVDHDHEAMTIRGLLCVTCNKDICGRIDKRVKAKKVTLSKKEVTKRIAEYYSRQPPIPNIVPIKESKPKKKLIRRP